MEVLHISPGSWYPAMEAPDRHKSGLTSIASRSRLTHSRTSRRGSFDGPSAPLTGQVTQSDAGRACPGPVMCWPLRYVFIKLLSSQDNRFHLQAGRLLYWRARDTSCCAKEVAATLDLRAYKRWNEMAVVVLKAKCIYIVLSIIIIIRIMYLAVQTKIWYLY